MRHALLALLLLALAPAGAGAATVTIVDAAGAEHAVDLGTLRPDVRDATYELRAEDGQTSPQAVPAGYSLRRLLEKAGVPIDEDYDYVEVPGQDEAALVMREQAAARARDVPPVVWEDADGLHFLAPLNGEEDVNVDDHVISADGTLTVRLERGFPIGIRVEASARRVRRGGSIHFRAVVVLGQREGMRFRWYFEDGRQVYGAERSQVFRAAGRHLVLVSLVSGDVAFGEDVVRIDVEAPRRPRRPRRRRPDPDPPAERSQGTGTGTGTGTGSGLGGIGTGARTSTGTTPSVASAPLPPLRRAPRRRAPREAPGRTVVSGTLLAAADTAPLAGGLSRSSKPRPAERDDAPLQLPTGVWVALAVAALLALGWALEARTTQPFWQAEPGAPESGP